MTSRNLLVPHDFTSAADVALTYAVSLAKKLSAEINLIHIVKESKDVNKSNVKLEEIIKNLGIKNNEVKN